MATGISDRLKAPNVCSVCKLRKKACDKVLPSCGFCSTRGLSCRYDIHAPDKNKIAYHYNPGRNFEILPTECDSSPSDVVTTATSQVADTEFGSQIDIDTRTVAEQAKRLIEALAISPSELGARYFDRCHDWLHVISPTFFHGLLTKEPGGVLSADASVLVLSMWLLTSLTTLNHETNNKPSNGRAQFFYNHIKSLFSQAQNETCASIPLIQAGLLLAECEYACVRPRSAYVTVAMCIAMARMNGLLDRFTKDGPDPTHENFESSIDEELRVAWALSMVERLVIAEISVQKPALVTGFPGSDTAIPPFMCADSLTTFGIAREPTLGTAPFNTVNEVGQEAQAVALLNEVLMATTSRKEDETEFLSRQNILDEKMRCFLALLLSQSNHRKTSLSASVAISVRSMFLLHKTALHCNDQQHGALANETRQAAWVALDTVCKMVTEVSRIFGPPSLNSIPLPCFYNMWDAMQHIQQTLELNPSSPALKDKEILSASIQQYQANWHL